MILGVGCDLCAIARVAEATEADMDAAVAAARAAFDEGPWPRMNARERGFDRTSASFWSRDFIAISGGGT